jgi:hypothetical protein
MLSLGDAVLGRRDGIGVGWSGGWELNVGVLLLTFPVSMIL